MSEPKAIRPKGWTQPTVYPFVLIVEAETASELQLRINTLTRAMTDGADPLAISAIGINPPILSHDAFTFPDSPEFRKPSPYFYSAAIVYQSTKPFVDPLIRKDA